MKRLLFLVMAIVFLVAFTACGGNQSGEFGSTGTTTPTLTPDLPQITDSKAEPTPASNPSETPLVLMPEDVLTAEDASSFVGCPVKTDTSYLSIDEGDGSASQRYEYDYPKDVDIFESTVLALLSITQNGLVSEEELKAGHDIKWAYEETKKLVANDIDNIPGLGKDAFYLKSTSQVHFLFQDYYIVVAFRNIKDQYNEAEDLTLNKAIAAHIINAISLAGVSLS